MNTSPIKSRNIWAYIANKEPGIIIMPETNDKLSSWEAKNAYIDTINVQTTSTNWDLYIYNEHQISASNHGLIGYWKLNRNAIDNAENNTIGTEYNMSYANGRIERCGSFTGNNSYIAIPHNTMQNIKTTGTISLWAFSNRNYPSDTSDTVYRGLVSKTIGEATSNIAYFIDWYGTNGNRQLRCRISNGTTIQGPTLNMSFNNEWVHICYTFDGQYYKLYINGILSNPPITQTISAQELDVPLNIGRTFSSTSACWDGLIDEVKIYNRALSAEEIINEYNGMQANMTKIASNLNGNQVIHPNLIYNNEINNQLKLHYVSKSGNELCNLYVKGELREKNIDTNRTSYWNRSNTSTYTANLAKSYFDYSPRNMHIISKNLSTGTYMLPRDDDLTSWHGKCAFISSIKITTTSQNYDVYLYKNEEYDNNAISTIKIGENLNLDNEIKLDIHYKSIANFVYLKIIDNDGTNSFDVYISGECREAYLFPTNQKQKIIIDHTKVTGTLINFPVLIKINSPNPIFLCSEDNGENIYFTGINDNIEYPAEIEYFSKEENSLVAWVKVPILSSSVDTEFYMHYTNSARKRTNNPKDAWDSNFVGVWHLGDSESGVLDSTGNNDMTKTSNAPVEVDGKINKAQQFDRTNRTYAECSTPDALAITDDLTMQAWIYPFETTGTNTQFIMARNTITTNIYYGIYRTNGTTNLGYVNVYIHGQAAGVIGISTPYPVNNWYHLVVTYSKPTLKAYLNGELVNTTSINPTGTGEGNFINIGARSNTADGTGSALGFNGNIDEVRISNIARNADWIATEYANQNDPNSFYSIIIEE